MSDNSAKYGFRPIRSYSGQASPVEVTVATGYQATNDAAGVNVGLSIGDPVKLVNDGSVALANSTQPAWGIIVGVKQYWDGSKIVSGNYVPGATAWSTLQERRTILLVQPLDPLSVWEIDVDDKVTATTEAGYRAFIGANCTHVCLGDNTTNASRPTANPKLDISLQATTAGLLWRIFAISQVTQDYDGTFVKLLVQANIGQQAGQAATTIAGI